MAIKFFVSYKYKDSDVHSSPVSEYTPGKDTDWNYTPRHYVDKIIEVVGEDNIYKGEKGDEDMSHLSDDTIDSKLKGKIFDSSVTVVLLSPNMREWGKAEKDQWIPNEIAYSLRQNKTRVERTSGTNGMLAVALPDSSGKYDYAFVRKECGVRTWQTLSFFTIVRENMFNRWPDEAKTSDCDHCQQPHHHGNDHSYIHPVTWDEFIENHKYYLEHAIRLRDLQKSEEVFDMKRSV